MFKRPFFLLGLFFGALAAFCLRLPKLRPRPAASTDLQAASSDFRAASSDFRGFLTDAFLICDSAGTLVEANAPAQAMFGANRLPFLRYATGQDVPPGQHPLLRAAVLHEAASGLYGFTAADGSERVLDVSARPLPDGGAAAVFRDVTAPHESKKREREAQAHRGVVEALCRRLSLAQTAEAAAQAVAEESRTLLSDVPDIQVKLFTFDPASDTLTCLASAPDGRPKRPKFMAAARPETVRFDAQVPELWQMYIARRPSADGLPLIAGGVAVGHLSVSSSAVNVFEDPAVRETLELIASLAALALAAPAASVQASASAAQTAAVCEIAAAIGSAEAHELADRITECVKRVTHADVCTLSVPAGGKLSVLGQTYKDSLLLPQTAPDDPRLHGKASRKAWRTRKTVTHLGLPPDTEAGPWRAFTGSAGSYSVIALPLADHGVLSVYTAGSAPLPEMQKKFLETVAALLSLSSASATVSTDGAD